MPVLSDTQILIITTVFGLVVSWVTARSTASSESVKSFSIALAGLRAEFEAVQKERILERREREAYKAYIEVLVKLLNHHEISVPPFPKWDEEL